MDSLRNIPVRVWGLPLMPWTTELTLDRIDQLIADRAPTYFITANLNYAMLCADRPELREINDRADFLVADGMPLVWASRLKGRRLPQRVAGSDLIYRMAERAAIRGYGVYLLGAAPGVADRAAERLTAKYPGLRIVGTECPPFRDLSADEQAEQEQRIRNARPDILFVAFGQPKGEQWVADNYRRLGVPVAVQVGASFDFVAGVVRRAPRIYQVTGLEWLYRLKQEPRRLLGRYLANFRFLFRAILGARFRKERTINRQAVAEAASTLTTKASS